MITNCVLSSKEIVFVVHVTLVKPKVMQKVNEMNIIRLKVEIYRNTFKIISTTVSHGLAFHMLQKMVRPGRIYKDYILLLGNLILTDGF